SCCCAIAHCNKIVNGSFEVGVNMSTRGRLAALFSILCAVPLGLTLAGCETLSDKSLAVIPDAGPATTPTVAEPGDVKYYPSDEPLRLGIEHFNRGNYGIAQRYFRDAVEKAPRDVVAWTGLAASYDRLSRFDLADRAYASAIKLAGETTQILNN